MSQQNNENGFVMKKRNSHCDINSKFTLKHLRDQGYTDGMSLSISSLDAIIIF